MIYYFKKDFKPFIKVKIKQWNYAFTNFEKIIQKAINIKAIISLKFNIII